MRGNGRVDDTGLERSGKKRASSGIGDHVVAIREIYGDTGRQAAVIVQNRERGGFAGNEALGQEESAGCGGRGRLLRRSERAGNA
jgi:hypothetical protein